MGLIKTIGRKPGVQRVLSLVASGYLQLVRRTNRFTVEPADSDARLDSYGPFIAAMWHGQHIMISFMRRPHDRIATIISRSPDGNINTMALTRMGVRVIRASGARGRVVKDARAKGGAEGLRAMVKALKGGETVAFSADVPKVSRVCDAGIIMLARFSGAPSYRWRWSRAGTSGSIPGTAPASACPSAAARWCSASDLRTPRGHAGGSR